MTCHECNGTLRKFGTYGKNKTQRYRCANCGKTLSGERKAEGMRIPATNFTRIIHLLCEGVGVRASARIAGVDKATVLRSLVLVGERCEKIMNDKMRGLSISDIESDEIWTFVGKKQRHLKPTDNEDVMGDFYTFVSLDRDTKLVINYTVGKRTAPTTKHFMADLAERLKCRPQISTDSFGAYRYAIRNAFGGEVDHGQIVKVFDKGTSDERRYSPPEVIASVRTPITGNPIDEKICTSHVERSNLSMRTFMRRFTRLCLGFSKKLENLRYAVALYFAWYNFVRVHASLKTTPAVAAKITDHVWTLPELLEA